MSIIRATVKNKALRKAKELGDTSKLKRWQGKRGKDLPLQLVSEMIEYKGL